MNLMEAMGMLRGRNPEQVASQLMAQNPQFKNFMESNKGKDPFKIAEENGVDLRKVMRMFK